MGSSIVFHSRLSVSLLCACIVGLSASHRHAFAEPNVASPDMTPSMEPMKMGELMMAPDAFPTEAREGVKMEEGLFGRKTVVEQVISNAVKRFADAFTAHQSKINFESEYLNPVEEELSAVMHAVELFQQFVLPPVAEVAKLPMEALRAASEVVDDLLRRFIDPEVGDAGNADGGGLGTVEGSCDRRTTYNIRSTDDLQENRADLECIFARGEAPRRPPLGVVVGRVHEAGATDLYNLAMKIWWAGKLAFQTRCGSSRDVFMIQNLIHKMRDQASQVHLGVINNEHMYRNVVDVLRKVGETEDGGHILLGKAMLRDPLDFPDNGDILAAFWSGVSYDHDAFQSSRGDFKLAQLDRSFTYRHQSIVEVLRRFLPLLELVGDPTTVGPLLYDSVLRWKSGKELLSPTQASAARNYRMGGEPADSQFRLGPYPEDRAPFSYLSGALPPRFSIADLLQKFKSEAEDAATAGVEASS
ncbi:hypothetical protein BESB_023610 [Besnoitia besnoiti]|uniref:With signal peptide plus Thr stretch, mucin, related protein n=1 Tax=Besnoitia besnoiti TaxID=94643 RepID=A0A2A9M1M3_BESBE|nr:hypothetical protein BESB_023610 [Besnoitia besnoiti]PFH31869.1 hypothetical protein BESB_023610 [Besnoitia besnoiti]